MSNLHEKWCMIKEFAMKTLGNNNDHGFEHVLRVVKYCRYIGIREHADLTILIPAAYLHDIARPIELVNPSIDHAEEGAKIAKDFLESIDYPCIDSIVYAIKNHRYRKKLIPKTLEAKILQDADRIDALGAIGIYRVISHAVNNGSNLKNILKHFEDKILKLYSQLHTKTAKELSFEKHKLVVEYAQFLKDELNFINNMDDII
ncbi:HD domain-containing protein [Thermosipho atlanticus]|uniref:HD domain-containing protein n=1 Tax=Thermosipho atlanticus DSM 15807 TaxID=1123380 RepID=A0A1M5SSV4_9BACT|nr:HD domain-containing protein [Thermosipho atlanticus]SHH41582.1 uncharacterized protein SAMN02745199_1062 [Thermosipho atlanticus DSM 15807]